MASVITTARRPSDPTRFDIEARKAEILMQQGWREARVDCLHEVNGLLLEQCDDQEDYRDPRQTEQWLPVPAAPKPEPREMSREDICNVDIRSLWVLNSIPECDDEQYTLGAVDPDAVDIGGDALAEYRESIAKPIAFQLKTEVQTHRDVRSFRSKRK